MSDQGNFNQKQGDPFDNYNNYNGFGGQQTVPNSVAVLVLGIISIVMCWCYGFVSIILAIVAIVLAGQGEKIYQANPQQFSIASYKNLRAGKICAIIGLSLGALILIYVVIYIIVVGSLAFAGLNSFGK
jgi:hypothetical protein